MQKIPVFRTFGNMLDSVIENLSTALSLSWPWLLVLFPIRLAGDVYHYWLDLGKHHPAGMAVVYNEADFIVGLFSAIAFASIAVNWHRYILRSEVAEGRQRLRLDLLVWRYFFFGILIVLPVLIVAALPIVLLSTSYVIGYQPSGWAGLLLFIWFPLLIVFLLAILRWNVKLVALALGDIDFTLRDAWAVTKGNTWRLLGLYLLLFLAIALIGLIDTGAGYGSSLFNSSFAAAVVAAVTVLVGWFSTLMGITMLTSVYSFFVEKRVY